MNPSLTVTASAADESPRQSTFTRSWQFLHHPLLLIGVGVLILGLQLTAQVLPQLPGQFVDDRVERARWLLSTQEAYGVLGPLLSGLGLFNFAHSFVLRLLLTLLTLLLLVQLGSLLATWQRIARLNAVANDCLLPAGEPIPTPGLAQIYRQRLPLPLDPAQAVWRLRQKIAQILPQRDITALSVDLPAVAEEDRNETTPFATEQRLLVVEHLSFLYLRLLCLAGIILALIVVWLGILYGWEVEPPVLIPGNQYRLLQRDLVLSYQMASMDEAVGAANPQPSLLVRLGEEGDTLPIGTTSSADPIPRRQLRLGEVGVWVQPATTALIVESWQGETQLPALALPGRTQLVERLGFAFPSVGSEESVLIPDAEIGLRIVRLPEDNRFLIEIIGGALDQETQRTEITSDDAIIVPLPDEAEDPEGAEDASLVLRFRYLPSLNVHVRYLPGEQLFWLGLLLALIGAVGFLHRPRFLLCQLAPWPVDRTVLVAQSDDVKLMGAITAWADTQEQANSSPAIEGDTAP